MFRRFPPEEEVETLVDLRPLVAELWSYVEALQERVERLERIPPQPSPATPQPSAGQ